MPRKKLTTEQKLNRLAWEAKKKQVMSEAYEKYLAEKGLPRSPENAHLFSLHWIHALGHAGVREEDVILALEGRLPDMW